MVGGPLLNLIIFYEQSFFQIDDLKPCPICYATSP
jgi:hypothetical protein